MAEKFKIPKDVRWLLLACIGVGTLIAFPIAAQFFAAKLLEPVASLWGSALGAWSGIAGALWVAERQVASQRRAAAALVRQLFHPLASALDDLTSLYGPPSRPVRGESNTEPEIFSIEEWKGIAEHAQIFLNHYDTFIKKVHRYEAGLNLLSASSLSAALSLETELADTGRTTVAPLTERPSHYNRDVSDNVFVNCAPTWSSRCALGAFNRQVQKHMTQLGHEAS